MILAASKGNKRWWMYEQCLVAF